MLWRTIRVHLLLALIFSAGAGIDFFHHQIVLGFANLLTVFSCVALAIGSIRLGWSNHLRWIVANGFFWVSSLLILGSTGGVNSQLWGAYMIALFVATGCSSSFKLSSGFLYAALNTFGWIALGLIFPLQPVILPIGVVSSQTGLLLMGMFGLMHNLIVIQESYAAESDAQRKRLEESQALLEQSEKLAGIGNLVAATAHEIAQPTQVILTATSLLRRMVERDIGTKEKLVQMTGQILDATERISRLLTRLKDFARKEAVRRQKMNVTDVVKSVAALLEFDPKWRGVHRKIEIENIPLWVFGDPLRLEQILLNLMSNACDAAQSANRPLVQLKAEPYRHWVRISVINNGTGIPLAIQPRLFEAYFTTKNRSQGTGLGLTICSQLVAQQNGRIIFSSEPENTIFVVDLPRLAEESQEPTQDFGLSKFVGQA